MMSYILLVLLAAVSAVEVRGHKCPKHIYSPYAETNKPFDELIFTQQWAPAACVQASLQKKHHCVIPANVTTWSVHGVWPTEGGSYGPNFCNKTGRFELSMLTPIRGMLMKYWPNLFSDEELDEFWMHEWCKHGTCAAELPAFSNELKYFSMGLKFNRLYDLQMMLQKAGITPNDAAPYKFADIHNAITSAIGHAPRLQCFPTSDKSHQTLIQIEICLDRSLSVIECLKKRKSNQILKYTRSEPQRLKRSTSGIPAQTVLCLENIPILYLPFQR